MADETIEQLGQRPDALPTTTEGLQPETQLEVDNDLRENDYDLSISMGVAIIRFAKPNDEEEQDRMDLVHHIYSLILEGKLHLAPIGDNPQRVLDLGTGTGIWAVDFADERPSAEVIGTDLSPIQPEWTPPNCSFEVDDYEDEWVYKKGFDFVHARELEGCIANDDRLFQQVFRHLRPNGYFELQGVDARFVSDDGTVDKATNAQLWMRNLREGSAKFGKPVDCAPEWKRKLCDAGFVDVRQEVRKLPIGAWPKDLRLKEIGRYQAIQELQVIDSYTPQLFRHVLGWNMEEIQVLMAQVKRELRDPSIHLYLPVYIVWGRKPGPSGDA
ncbi:hypothetical protein CEP54_013850 [Fusarium duplospermum]|uniref:Methyltransferase n=1 Tax=Fusarium duplospermum TaxID=1325734 RepID=A0A428P0H1_9HYPO|nr:hypothetical protein CEP54_013850 [Fusarium duplospermum]